MLSLLYRHKLGNMYSSCCTVPCPQYATDICVVLLKLTAAKNAQIHGYSHPRRHSGLVHPALATNPCCFLHYLRKLIAALSSPAGVKSHLAGEFDLQEHWDPAANLGNPMHSMQIGDMINGFHDEAAEPGYQKRGAVLLEGAEMLQLLQHMCSDLITPTCEQSSLMSNHCSSGMG